MEFMSIYGDRKTGRQLKGKQWMITKSFAYNRPLCTSISRLTFARSFSTDEPDFSLFSYKIYNFIFTC